MLVKMARKDYDYRSMLKSGRTGLVSGSNRFDSQEAFQCKHYS